jgi:hypothetical protein
MEKADNGAMVIIRGINRRGEVLAEYRPILGQGCASAINIGSLVIDHVTKLRATFPDDLRRITIDLAV